REPGQRERGPEDERLLEVGRRGGCDVVRVPGKPDPRVREREADRVVADLEEPVEPGAAEDRAVGLRRVGEAARRREDDDAADHEGEQERQERRDDAARLLPDAVALRQARAARLRRRVLLELRQLAGQAASLCLPPVIANPSSSSVAVGGNSPTIPPSKMTRIRSASPSTSSSSSETSRIALPSSRSSIRRRCT